MLDNHVFRGSRAIYEASYDKETQTLDIVFTTGRRYSMSGVPPDAWEGLKTAPSPGSYFNDYLKGQY